MTEERFLEMFEGDSDEFLQFDKVENKRSNYRDVHAFLLLEELMPIEGESDIVDAAEHDMFYLSPRYDELAAKITEEQVIELIRCGVMFQDDSLCMYA